MNQKLITTKFLKYLPILFVLFVFASQTTYSFQLSKITIDASKDIGPAKLLQGFLHGNDRQDPFIDPNLVNSLKPKFWRIGIQWQKTIPYIIKVKQKFDTKITFNIQDLLGNNVGYVAVQTPGIDCRKYLCFHTFSELKQYWAAETNKIMKRITSPNNPFMIEYIDVFAEPNNQIKGVTPLQFCELFEISHNIIRRYNPTVKIVAPSTGSPFRTQTFKPFLEYIAAHNLKLDALSWHEFSEPQNIMEHTNEARVAIDEVFSSKPHLKPKEIHINEYAPYDNHLIPGYAVGWLYYMEKAGIDWGSRACWNVPYGFKRGNWSDCWAGLNGMFTKDPPPGSKYAAPQHIYWVHKAYADMEGGTRLSSSSNTPTTEALASKHYDSQTIRILAGIFLPQKSRFSEPSKVEITILNYPYSKISASHVLVNIQKIPNNNNRAEPFLEPLQLPAKTVRITENNTITILLDNVTNGDAYSIIVNPQ